jgi:hypothetical protein
MKRSILLITLLALLAGCLDSGTDENNEVVDAGSDAADPANADAAGADAADADIDVQPDVSGPSEVTLNYDFETGKQGWSAGLTDYPNGGVSSIGFASRVDDLPEEMDETGKAFFLQGQNDPIDIFMFIKRQVGADQGLHPQTSYRLDYTVTFASNYPDDCTDAEQGQKMYLKMGASKWEPSSKLNNDQTYHELNVRKGDGAVGGDAASTAGDLTHDVECALVAYTKYVPVTRQHTHTASVETTDEGNLWLLLGVDSEYHGETSFYIDTVEVTLKPQAE